MATMTIDVDAIEALGTDLKSAVTEFQGANTNSDQIAACVGHPGLSDTVRNFAHKWDDTRAKMEKTMDTLSQAAIQVAQAWRQADQQGADALNGQTERASGPREMIAA